MPKGERNCASTKTAATIWKVMKIIPAATPIAVPGSTHLSFVERDPR
jgi:hypothetical protein